MRRIRLPRHILRSIENPARYLGGEWKSVSKDERTKDGRRRLRFAFCFPDLYEIGMSNLALRILYDIINRKDDWVCERFFSPAPDLREIMKREGIPLFSIEEGHVLSEMDIVGFTLQYEMSFPTILDMLDLGGVPLLQSQRREADPLVVAGGPVAFNAEPIAAFFDLIMIGDGEELLPEVISLWDEMKAAGFQKKDFLRKAASIEGVYVPSLYRAVFDEDGHFSELRPIDDAAPPRVRKRVVKNLDAVPAPCEVLVPNVEIVHDRVFLELFRGCANGCRFCQAGMIYRPVRERSPETLLRQAEEMLRGSGYEEIGLLSLSTGDYSQLIELCDGLLAYAAPQHINLSLPSLRLNSVSMELLERASRTRKSGLTFAPEAGTQIARNRINKNITEHDLIEAARDAFANGWDRLKLYFMLGLPGETDEDILGIAELCQELIKIWQTLHRGERRRLHITVSTSIFIPKPWTPFQWEGQISIEEMARRQKLLARALRHPAIRYQWHDFETSFIEAVLARGGRELSDVLLELHRQGAWMESENFGFSYERWMKAFESCGIDARAIASAERDEDEAFPWDFMDPGPAKAFLLKERSKSRLAETTPDCYQACSGCGSGRFACGLCPEAKEVS